MKEIKQANWLHWTKTGNFMGRLGSIWVLSRSFGCWALAAILLGGWILTSGITWLVTPVPDECVMTFMFPTYIDIDFSGLPDIASNRYKLYLYHEGPLDEIDSDAIQRRLSGVPVLFIPGNGGSYKQVRSLAAESDRAYNEGPRGESLFQRAVLTTQEAGSNVSLPLGGLQKDLLYTPEEPYANKLDWFTVDLHEEHSAMNGRILEEHTEVVVHAINRILDKYRESWEARYPATQEVADYLPKNVILVGHSMGGFIARAAVVQPQLRTGAVETIVTLSSPHLSAPLPLQLSLCHFFTRVNDAWRKGYESPHTTTLATTEQVERNVEPALSRVVVVSVFGGTQDYQVRSRFASLDEIIPPTNGLTIGTSGIPDIWLSLEHQSMVWCNQFVVHLSHTMLQLVDKKTGQPLERPQTRLAIFVTNLRSALPQVFGWLPISKLQGATQALPEKNSDSEAIVAENEEEKRRLALDKNESLEQESTDDSADEVDETRDSNACPKSTQWTGEGKEEEDVYIDSPSITVLAMDGKRRWSDINRMRSNGKTWFTLVTNLAPCSGVRVHLWPEKGGPRSKAVAQRLTEVTGKMIQLPSGPEKEMQPGGQSEQAQPTGMLHLTPQDLQGYGFLSISVASRPSFAGGALQASPMAVSQFYDPEDGKHLLSPWSTVSSIFMRKGIVLRENHPLIADITMAVSLGTLPMVLEINATRCGFANSLSTNHKRTASELHQLCTLQCFPPLVLVWDPPSGLEVFTNVYRQTVTVDASPPMWGSKIGPESTTVILLVDPHCEYNVGMRVSFSAAACRFLLVHSVQVMAVIVAALFFAMMRQARAWELEIPVPSLFACIEANLTFPFPYVTLAMGPMTVYVMLTVLGTHRVPQLLRFVLVSNACYIFANGALAVLALVSTAIFYSTAFLQVFIKLRWLNWEKRWRVRGMRWLFTCMPGTVTPQVNRTMQSKATLMLAIVAGVLAFFFHPALGLIVLLFAHAWKCHCAFYSYTLNCKHQTSTSRPGKRSNSVGNGINSWRDPILDASVRADWTDMGYADSQLEVFHQSHGVLLLHFSATLMYIPSLVASIERGRDWTLPGLEDSFISFGIILHGLFASNADANMVLFSKLRLPGSLLDHSGLSFIYGLAGIYCYIAGLTLAPYRTFLAMAFIGYLATVFRLWETIGTRRKEMGMRRRYYQRHD